MKKLIVAGFCLAMILGGIGVILFYNHHNTNQKSERSGDQPTIDDFVPPPYVTGKVDRIIDDHHLIVNCADVSHGYSEGEKICVSYDGECIFSDSNDYMLSPLVGDVITVHYLKDQVEYHKFENMDVIQAIDITVEDINEEEGK